MLAKRVKAADRKHHAALAFSELPTFVRDLREQDGTAARALEFLILTAARTSETIGAQWPEVDLQALNWTVPKERMKGGRPHRVPLSARAAEILRAQQEIAGDGEYIFPGRDGALSNMALLALLERMGRSDLTVHGFRSTFRDWAGESTNFPREVIEMALAHRIAGKTEEAYWRGDLYEKRRKLMEAWARFIDKPAASVTALDSKRRRA
jgi:integrase